MVKIQKKYIFFSGTIFVLIGLLYLWKFREDYIEEKKAAVYTADEFAVGLNPDTLNLLKEDALVFIENRRFNGLAEFSDRASAAMENLYDPSASRFTVTVYLKIDKRHVLYITGDSEAKSYFILTKIPDPHTEKLYNKEMDFTAGFISFFRQDYNRIIHAKGIRGSRGEFQGLIVIKSWLKNRNAQNYKN
ncbi:MAG: hypothetical protein OEZ34_14245 [Spirochaetia bacterium]|nr:hypothetical protein [Spirochaetia bacterium]